MNCNDCSGFLPYGCTCSGGPFNRAQNRSEETMPEKSIERAAPVARVIVYDKSFPHIDNFSWIGKKPPPGEYSLYTHSGAPQPVGLAGEPMEDVARFAIEVIQEYADPSFYHAIAIMADRPAGGFADDFSFDKQYGREMPGKHARESLLRLQQMLNGWSDSESKSEAAVQNVAEALGSDQQKESAQEKGVQPADERPLVEALELIAAQGSGIVASTNKADCMAAIADQTLRNWRAARAATAPTKEQE